MTHFKSFVTILLLLASSDVYAARFKGYGRPLGSEDVMTLTEPLARKKESSKEFLILVHGHAAFYAFPKKPENNEQVREYLASRLKSKNPIQIVIDPTTAQIIEMKDP